jgi:hypothetical protein
MTTRKQQKVIDEHELVLVHDFARAIARANGHSHPDEHADRVVAAYKGELEPAEASGGEAGEGSGGEA